MCLTEDGSSGGLGKPIRCWKSEAAARNKGDDRLVYKECLAGCGHYHLYSPEYITAVELEGEIKRLGPDKALEALKAALTECGQEAGGQESDGGGSECRS